MNRWLSSTVDTYIQYFGKTHEPVVYEVGSRDGKDGVELTERIYKPVYHDNLWGDSEIVLFECNPPQQEVIRKNYPNARLIPYAISDKSGKEVEFLQMHGDQNIVGSSSMDLNRINEPWLKDSSVIKVQTRRLDEIIEQLGHDEIDIMKIDIEHYTMEALLSLGKHLDKVKVFHLETEPEDRARKYSNLDVALFMQERGYLCTALDQEWGDSIQDSIWFRKTSKS